MLRCVLVVPLGPTHEYWRDQCAAYASRRGYLVVAVAANWDAAMDIIYARQADVIVLRPQDKRPDRLPRTEVIGEETSRKPPPEQRRPVIQIPEDH